MTPADDLPDHEHTRDPQGERDTDGAAAEIVPAGASFGEDAGPAAGLSRWLEQAHRDATANRAQVHELSRTLERVRESHEYVGKALRKEQRRGRYLGLVALLAPLLAGLLVWAIWRRTDGVRQEIDGRLGAVVASQDDLRRGQTELERRDVAEAYAVRLTALEEELGRAREDLGRARSALAAETGLRATEGVASARREAELQATVAGFEQDREELRGLRAQVSILQTRAGAETARADRLANEIRALESQLGAARARLGGAAGATANGAASPRAGSFGSPSPQPLSGSTAPIPPVPERWRPEAAPGASLPPVAAEAADGAARRPADTDRVRAELNRLLALSAGAVTYTVDTLGGVEGDRLLDVAITGRDAAGRPIRTLEAKQGSVTVKRENDQVLVVLQDGHLLLGGHRAPFFDGRYSVVVDVEPEAWRISSLTCLRFE